jgi:hypothetical protein
MNKQLTAVEWLEKELKEFGIGGVIIHQLFQQALELEKQQIIKARSTAPLLTLFSELDYIEEAEQYYSETYKKQP